MNKLTAPAALEKYIVEYANSAEFSDYKYEGPLDTERQIFEAFSDMRDAIGCDATQDVMEGRFKTEIDPEEHSRYCEIESVAVEDNYGNFIGFSRYYGGGKHFSSSDYYDTSIENAYYLSCEEKEVLTIQRTWAKI